MPRSWQSSCGPTDSRPAPRAASRHTVHTSAPLGHSQRTRKRPRACSCISRSLHRLRRWWSPAAAMTYPPTRTLQIWKCGRAGPPKGHALSLSQSLPPSEALDHGLAGTAKDCAADRCTCDDDQDGAALHARRATGKNARLGGGRVRRLHADLKTERRLGHLTDRKSTRSCLPLDGRFDLEAT